MLIKEVGRICMPTSFVNQMILKKKGIRIVIRTIVGLIVIPVALLLIVFLLLQMPMVQRVLIDKAEDVVKEEFNLDCNIGSIGLTWQLDFSLNEVKALDAQRDTVLYVRELVVETNIWEVLKNQTLKINDLHLYDITADTKDLIPSMVVRGNIGTLHLVSDSICFSDSSVIAVVNELQLKNADIHLDLFDSEETVDTTASSPFTFILGVQKVSMENIDYSMNLEDLSVHLGECEMSADCVIGDVSSYHVDDFHLNDARFAVADMKYEIERVDMRAAMDSTFISVPSLYALAYGTTVKATAAFDIDSLYLTADADVKYGDNEIYATGEYNITTDEYAADVTFDVENFYRHALVELPDFLTAKGHLTASGKGFDPFCDTTVIAVNGDVEKIRFGSIKADQTSFDVNLRNSIASGTLITNANYADASMNASVDCKLDFNADLLRYDVDGVLSAVASYGSDTTLSVSLNSDIAFSGKALTSKRPSITADIAARDILLRNDNLAFDLDSLSLYAHAGQDGSEAKLRTQSLTFDAGSEQHAFDIVDMLPQFTDKALLCVDSLDFDIDKLKPLMPEMTAKLNVKSGNPFETFYSNFGIGFESMELNTKLSPIVGIDTHLDIENIVYDTLALKNVDVRLFTSDKKLNLKADADFERQHGLPHTTLLVEGNSTGKSANVNLNVHSDVVDGILTYDSISGGIDFVVNAGMDKRQFAADGSLTFDDLVAMGLDFGDVGVHFDMSPADAEKYVIQVATTPVSAAIANAFIPVEGLEVDGLVSAKAKAIGSFDDLKISAEVQPKGIEVTYAPLFADIKIGDVPIIMDDMVVKIQDLPIIAEDSTLLNINGICNLYENKLNVNIVSDRFKPLPLNKIDTIPYHGKLAVGMDVNIHGSFDNIAANGSVSILPESVLTYNMGRKNYIHACPNGTVVFDYAGDNDMKLNGSIAVNNGEIKYTLPYYPLEPFDIKDGSSITFNGPVEDLGLDIKATQRAKAMVKEGDRTRDVDFIVGIDIQNGSEGLELHFTMEAPNDPVIQKEINGLSTEDRDRIALALLTTGMYTSDTNAALDQSGYALSSIMQKSLNAVTRNNLGKYVDIDLGVGENTRNGTTTTNYTVDVSKTFFSDRLKIKVGGRVSDQNAKGQDTKSTGFLDELSAEWLLKKNGKTRLLVFSKIDYENIMDGEIHKEGIGIKSDFDLTSRKHPDDLPWQLDLEGNLSYRSNDQFGPSGIATVSKRNLLHLDETMSVKLDGSYYWKVRERIEGDAALNDNFHTGVDVALSYPSIALPWHCFEVNGIPTSTTYDIGYMYENIAGGYAFNRVNANIAFNFQNSNRISQQFMPIAFSYVGSITSEKYLTQISNVDDLHKIMLQDELIPAMQYRFTYNNAVDKERFVTTRFDAKIKESGLIGYGIMAAAKVDFSEKNKYLYNQFVKISLELRNKFKLTPKHSVATRAYIGSIFTFGNSNYSPMSELFYSGGINGLRGFPSRLIGPGNYHNEKYDSYRYHGGELKFELNAEYRFPLVWMLEGAFFIEAGNVWDRESFKDQLTPEEIQQLEKLLGISIDYDNGLKWKNFFNQLALDSGFGVRFVYQSIVVRLDTGFVIHHPYDTGTSSYFNVNNFWKDGIRINFGIGYPF